MAVSSPPFQLQLKRSQTYNFVFGGKRISVAQVMTYFRVIDIS